MEEELLWIKVWANRNNHFSVDQLYLLTLLKNNSKNFVYQYVILILYFIELQGAPCL